MGKRMSNWFIAQLPTGPNEIFRCYRKPLYGEDSEAFYEYDTCVFYTKEDAVHRCRELNAQLVSGWMADGHPQNW